MRHGKLAEFHDGLFSTKSRADTGLYDSTLVAPRNQGAFFGQPLVRGCKRLRDCASQLYPPWVWGASD
jgi:hypothetical protein